jgi:predicted nucleic acid-binding protein
MIITDSGFWVALVNPDDTHHKIAVKTLAKINEPLTLRFMEASNRSRERRES